jgi:3-carboxy-cis,cis-muconate cycloisomerase
MNLLSPLFRSVSVEAELSDLATLQGMLDFESALARAESRAGIIPASAATSISAACHAEKFDRAALAESAAIAGNLAIPLIKQLTSLIANSDPDSSRFVHFGATSQDAIDTGMILQLRRAFELLDQDLASLTSTLSELAQKRRLTPIAARTWVQQALPTTFGFIVAGWLDAVLRHRRRIREIRPRLLTLQFGGAVGTLASLSGRAPEIAKSLARDLGLAEPAAPWHSHRDRFAESATTLGLLTGTLGKIARDISLHTQTEIAELFEPSAPGRGGSSTLPHKRNPVTCAVILAAALRVPPLVSTMLAAMPQEYQRGLGNWHAEWETLPDIFRLTGGALHHLTQMLPALEIDTQRMAVNLELTHGLIFAEAVSMAAAQRLGKSAAHALVETACARSRATGQHLKDALLSDPTIRDILPQPELDRLFDASNYFGSAGAFVDRVLAEAAQFSTLP